MKRQDLTRQLRDLADTLDALDLTDVEIVAATLGFQLRRYKAEVNPRFRVLRVIAGHLGVDLGSDIYDDHRGVPIVHVSARSEDRYSDTEIGLSVSTGFATDEPLPNGIVAIPADTIYRLAETTAATEEVAT